MASSSAGGHLESFDLDEFLDPVEQEQVAFGVEPCDVAGVQPAIVVDGRGAGGRVTQVAGHHRGGTDPQLAGLAGDEVGAGARVGDAGTDAGQQRAR